MAGRAAERNLKMIEQIRANIKKEREIIDYLRMIDSSLASESEREFYSRLVSSLTEQMRILNSAIPSLVADIPEFKMPSAVQQSREEIRIVTVPGKLSVSKQDRVNYLKQTESEAEILKSIKKRFPQEKKKTTLEFAKVNPYAKLSSRIFSGLSINLSRSEVFKPLNDSLKKSGMPYLISTYISMMLLSTLAVFFCALLIVPFIIVSGIIDPMIGVMIILGLPIVSIIAFLIYPSSEGSSNKSKINDELPFAVMHMSAIAGSGIEPSKVFGILAVSEEYPAIRKEMMKIMNQVNFYGYNLVSALRSTAKSTSNDRLANILNGIATTISSGGDLKEYLSKIAEDTMLDYKLRRKRFITISETYADIYTGLLVAAPLMFMLILVLMNVIGGGVGGMDSGTLALTGIGVLIVVNIGFLVFLQFSQPES